MVNSAWASARLQYVTVEPHHDPFLQKLSSNARDWMNAAPHLPVPQGTKKQATEGREWMEKCLLGVVMCLPADKTTTTADGKEPEPIPIGQFTLSSGPGSHHRHAMIGLTILTEYQGKGYGTEAIQWGLHWAFRYANLHRIEIGAAGYNPRAIALYERLGFKFESRQREALFHDGQYYDQVGLGMLDREWEELYGKAERQQTLVTSGL